MKYILLILSAILSATVGFGQSNKNGQEQISQHKQFIDRLMGPQLNSTANSKMVLSERVIAQSTYDNYLSTKNDSVKIDYVLNGVSTYDFNKMLYAYNYPYSTSPMFNYLGVFTKPQVEYANYSHWTINPNTLIYGFYEKDMVGYDINKNLIRDTALFADSAIYPNMTYYNLFNVTNNIDTSYSYVYDAGVSNNAFKQFFSYNVMNKVTKDSIYEYDSGSWYLVSKTFYSYDASNNLILIDNFSNNDDTTFTLPLIEQVKYTNTYDASNRLKTVHTSYFDGTALTPSVIDTFAYSGTYPFHLSWKEYQYDAINSYWAPMTYMTKTLNVAGFPDVINIQTFDSLSNSWVPSVRQIAYYNANNNPIKLDEYIYNFTSFPSTPDFTTNYFYETYNNTTTINSTLNSDKLTLYPNPSINTINIKGFEKNNFIINARFYDVSGRIISVQTSKLLGDEIQISLEDLVKGIYLLVLEDKEGNIICKKSVVKL